MSFRSDLYFFFSSRRRHTRWPRDWSSDVCSSDLRVGLSPKEPEAVGSSVMADSVPGRGQTGTTLRAGPLRPPTPVPKLRSEERRVGKEGRTRWAQEGEKKKKRGKGSKRSDVEKKW